MAQPGTQRQIPDHSIFDYFRKQHYLGNYYKYALNFTSGGTTEVAEILLQNPAVAASAFPSGYISLFVDLRRLSSLTASDSAVMRTYFNPTFSVAGTAQTPVNVRPASLNVSNATLTTAPTVSVNGTLIETIAAASYVTTLANDLYILDPGESLLITLQNTASSAAISASIGWFEL